MRNLLITKNSSTARATIDVSSLRLDFTTGESAAILIALEVPHLLSMTRIRMQEPRRQLKKNGAVIVQKFLTGAETAELQSVVRAIYEAMAEIGTFADADMENHFRRWNGVWLEHLPGLLEGYDRDLAARYRGVIELIARRTQRVFGVGWHFFALRSFLRRLSAQIEFCRGTSTPTPRRLIAPIASTSGFRSMPWGQTGRPLTSSSARILRCASCRFSPADSVKETTLSSLPLVRRPHPG